MLALAAGLALGLPQAATAQSVGVVLSPFAEGSAVAGVSGSWAVTSTSTESDSGLWLLGRLDAATALDFVTPPSLGLMPVVELRAGSFATYTGTGFAVAWQELAGETSSFVTWTGLAGARLHVNPAFALKVEVVGALARDAYATQFGVEVAPWR
jgi:hypothetical protein